MTPLKIITPKEPMGVENIVTTIYGNPGVGKTTLAFSAARPLLLDFDMGVARALSARTGAVVEVRRWQDILDLDKTSLDDYDTVVVDTVGRCIQLMGRDIVEHDAKMRRSGVLSLQGYGILKARFESWLSNLRGRGVDIVLIAHNREDRKGDDQTVDRLDAQGSSREEVYKVSDLMGRLMIDEEGERKLDFRPRPGGFGKDPTGRGLVAVPHPADPQLLAGIMAEAKVAMTDIGEAARDSQARVDALRGRLDGLEGVDAWNAIVDEMANGDATPAERRVLVKEGIARGMRWDKDAKRFAEAEGA